MACCFVSTKPSPEPMPTYGQLDPDEHISIWFRLTLKHFIHENVFNVISYQRLTIMLQPRHFNLCCDLSLCPNGIASSIWSSLTLISAKDDHADEYSNEEWVCYASFNSLWLSDTIWQYRSWSTLAQVMASCYQAYQAINQTNVD